MLEIVLRLFFLLCAGIFLQMGMVHVYRPEETKTHYMIRRAKSPRRASAIWGLGQLASGIAIAIACNFSLAFKWESLSLFAGFAIWGLFLANLDAKKIEKPRMENGNNEK